MGHSPQAASAPPGLADLAAQLAAAPAGIAYLGHSVTAQRDGYRRYLHAGLVSRFEQPHRAINAGFGGVGSVVSACVADRSVIQHRPALCFIECMTGDIGVGLHADTGPALEGILRKLARAGCAACLLNLPRRDTDGARGGEVVELYARIVGHHRTPVVDLVEALSGEGDGYFRDVVHTTPEGGRRTAELILAALEPLFAAPRSQTAAPPQPLFARDYLDASFLPAALTQLSQPATGRSARFRLTLPFVAFGDDNEITFCSNDHELLGLVAVVGPHSGPTRVDDQVLQLADRWSHYERLHGIAFDAPFAAGAPVRIAPLQRAVGQGPPQMRLNGFLTRPVGFARHRAASTR